MNSFYFYVASFFSFVTLLNAEGPEELDCLEKEKALTSLETAEDLLSKAEDSFPSCNEDSNSTDKSECSGKKPLAFIEISKKLISDVRGNFPTCSKVIGQNVKHRDCSEILESGWRKSGVYTIYPSESNTTGKPLEVYCDMKTDKGGWTVIQRRGKFPVQQDFNQTIEIYTNGFGNITEEFWLGTENIRVLCYKGCEIRFDLKDKDGIEGFAVYKIFNLTGDDYILYISNYTGDTGDSMMFSNYQSFFTTKEMSVERFDSGWWHNQFDGCSLNGKYRPGKRSYSNVYWFTWRKTENVANVEIKVRPN